MSPTGRYCRKSRKSNEAKNLANVDFWTTPPLRCSVAPIRRSVVAFLRSEVVPHVAAPETHQQLWKISFVSPKRLFRQYRSKPEKLKASKCFPLFTQQRTSPRYFGMSEMCQQQKCRSVCWQPVSSRQARNFEFELVLSAFVATALQCNLIRLPPR